MSMPITDVTAYWVEQRRRYPRPECLLPTPWPLPLKLRRGKDRLGHLPVYYDFSWETVVGHRRRTFPNGRSLALLTQRECPDGKYPAMLLTVRDDVEERPIITDSHFIVIVKMRDYLNRSSADAATSYFARITGTDITSLVGLKETASTPEGLEFLLSIVDIAALKEWAATNSDALFAMAEVTATDGFAELLRVLTVDDAAKILEWAIAGKGRDHARQIVERVREDSLPSLYTLTGIARLKKALQTWRIEQQNASEEFWQKELSKNSFLLCQLFSQPIVVLKEKAYVGGKHYDNTGGNLVDFLNKNNLTRNFVMVEIKTPCTSLVGSTYRGDVLNVSAELTGAVLQATNYKYHLVEDRRALVENHQEKLFAFDPPCVVVIGNTTELDTDAKIKAFEHFRNGLKHVEVITFDEMYAKLDSLVAILEGENKSPKSTEPSPTTPDSIASTIDVDSLPSFV